jgi:hypothetical protein
MNRTAKPSHCQEKHNSHSRGNVQEPCMRHISVSYAEYALETAEILEYLLDV